MKQLIIHGDPGIRKGAVVDLDGEEYVCFGISRQGEFHGPEAVQLWCTVGKPDEYESFQRREFVPMRLPVDDVDAEAVEVVEASGELVA